MDLLCAASFPNYPKKTKFLIVIFCCCYSLKLSASTCSHFPDLPRVKKSWRWATGTASQGYLIPKWKWSPWQEQGVLMFSFGFLSEVPDVSGITWQYKMFVSLQFTLVQYLVEGGNENSAFVMVRINLQRWCWPILTAQNENRHSCIACHKHSAIWVNNRTCVHAAPGGGLSLSPASLPTWHHEH